MSRRPGFRAIGEALGQPAFGVYVAGNSISLVGNWVQRTAVGWYAWELTGSALWVGATAMADLAPSLLVGPIGGVMADRHERRRIMLVSQGLLTITALAMWVLAASGRLDLAGLLVLVAIHGLFVGVNQPARLAFIPSLVPMQLLPTAVAVNSIVFNLARLVGPAIAGVTIATIGLSSAFALNTVSYLAFILALWRIRPLEAQPIGQKLGLTRAFSEGLLHAARHPVLGPMFVLFIAGSLTLRAIGELLPALSGRLLDGDVGTLAWLSSSMGLGAVLGGLWVARSGSTDQLRLALLGHLGAMLAAALFLLATELWTATPLLALLGCALIVSGISAQTLIQLSTTSGMRGRVMSLFGLVFRATPALGALAQGALGDIVGLKPSIAIGIVLLLVVWIPLWQRRASLQRELEAIRAVDTPPTGT